jgi:conjugal transfer ATP-binding protein TraC
MKLFNWAKKVTSSPVIDESSVKQRVIDEFQDFIAPSAIDISTNYIQINKRFARTIYISDYPRFLSLGWLTPIINFNDTIDISLFLHPMDSGTVLKELTKKLARIKAEISERQDKGLLSSPLLEAAEKEMEDMRNSLQEGKERIFRFGCYITFYAGSLKELQSLDETIEAIFTNTLVVTRVASLIQEKGFNSTLPIGMDELYITKLMSTGPLSTTFPFVSADLTDDKGILYGINLDNNSLVIFDRFSLENANTVIIGKSGGGKSYAAKLEILRSLMLGADVMIIDPENEYEYLAQTVDGAYFKISLTSEHHINPFDLRQPGEGETVGEIIQENIIDLAAILKIMLGGVSAEEDAILDRSLQETYASRDITPETELKGKIMPTLSDLQAVLDNMSGAESLSKRLEKFTRGRFAGFFNQQTNIPLNKKLIVFNIRDMEEELRPSAMYIIISYVWKQIRLELKRRLLFIDEAWWLLQYEESAQFLLSIAKRARKYYLGLTTITQDASDFTKSRFGEPILTNSSLQFLFKQSPTTISETKRVFGLTEQEKNFLLETRVGQGLFFAGIKHVTIQVEASYSENQIITSDPEEILRIKEAKKELEK